MIGYSNFQIPKFFSMPMTFLSSLIIFRWYSKVCWYSGAFYLAERCLKIITHKCKALTFRNKGRSRFKKTDLLKINNKEIEFSPTSFTSELSFKRQSHHFQNALTKTKCSYFAMSKFQMISKISVKSALKFVPCNLPDCMLRQRGGLAFSVSGEPAHTGQDED